MTDFFKDRDFKGVWIPKEIYLNQVLNWSEKILLIEIDSLCKNDRCFASNEYFARFFQTSVRNIQRWIKTLKDKGFIEQASFDGRQRVLRSLLHVCNDKHVTSNTLKVSPIIIENNNTSNNTISKQPELLTLDDSQPQSDKITRDMVKAWWNSLAPTISKVEKIGDNRWNAFNRINKELDLWSRRKWYKERFGKIHHLYFKENWFKFDGFFGNDKQKTNKFLRLFEEPQYLKEYFGELIEDKPKTPALQPRPTYNPERNELA
jgi:hypothetical protein